MYIKLVLRITCLVLIPLLNRAQNFGGHPSSVKWKQVNSKTARIIFPASLGSQAQRIHAIIEKLDATTASTIGGQNRKWNVLLLNHTTIANAYVRMAPVISEFNMTPPQDNFSQGSIRWDDNLVIHENRHMQQLSNFNHGLTKVFSFFLGQEGQLLANGIAIPNYFFEGDAVWQETLVSKQGRGRLPDFFNGFNALWQANKQYSWMKLRSGSYRDYLPDHYQLGYLLVAYGYEKYGADFWKKVTQDAVRFKPLIYPFNNAIKKYSGKSYAAFRSEAINYFKQEFKNATGNYHFITPAPKNNVADYAAAKFIGEDSILVTKKSFRKADAFYIICKGKEKKIRLKNKVLNDYFNYAKGKVVYASYQSDPRWGNQNYSVLQVLDINSGKQKQISSQSKYFSPDLSPDAQEILAVKVNIDGTNFLTRINAGSGQVIATLPNPANYFFTQVKYDRANQAIVAARNTIGEMALLKVNLTDGEYSPLTPFSVNVLGYPFIQNDTVYFSAQHGKADQLFALHIPDKKLFKLTENTNGIYYPAANASGQLMASLFTAEGLRLVLFEKNELAWQEMNAADFSTQKDIIPLTALNRQYYLMLDSLRVSSLPVTKYRKSFRLFNFHSRRPVIADPEYGYSFYSDNYLSSFSNALTYTYNRNEKSHTIGFYGTYAGWYPVITAGAEASFHRVIDTAVGKSINFSSAKLNATLYVPLFFAGGRFTKSFSIGAGYNAEQLYYYGIGKNIFSNTAFRYANSFITFSNLQQRAIQQVNSRWGQSIALSYRYAFNVKDSRKFVANSSFYFPGLFNNHSLVLQGSFQKRDTLADIFSNTFSYSRGYSALSTRRMFKWGVNYQLPVLYPDLGVGNIIFFQRVRLNGFYDYTNAYARLNGKLTNILSRSTGAELYFDAKIWNSLPFSFGIRYAQLLDTDLRNPGANSRWDFILFNFIPN